MLEPELAPEEKQPEQPEPEKQPEPVETKSEEQMVTIPKKQYDELVKANDSVFLAMMAAYDKFDDIIGNVMNLNTIVFNKKRELKTLIYELGKENPVDSIK